MKNALTSICNDIWKTGKRPTTWTQSPTERKLTAVSKLQNHNDSKVMVKIISNRLQPQAEDIISGEQGAYSMLSRCLHPMGT